MGARRAPGNSARVLQPPRIMECRGSGVLLITLVILVLGATLLPEPCDAAPRRRRNPAPQPRCPNCARDCPQNLAGDSMCWARRQKLCRVSDDVLKVINTIFGIGKYLLGSEINEDYQSLSAGHYSPPVSQPAYETLQPSAVYSPPQLIPSYQSPQIVPSYSSQLPVAVSSYTPPLPTPSYDPRLPAQPCSSPQVPSPSPEVPCYDCSPPSAPASFNLLPKSQSRYETWRRSLGKYNRSPYAVQNYRPRFYSQGAQALPLTATDYDCECGCEPKFQLDDSQDLDEDASYDTYNRRSSEAEAPRVSRHYSHHAQHAEPPSLSTNMYKTYVPYVREETPADPDESERRGRERLYVVYRADATKPEEPLDENQISERELETVIRKAIEIARQQRNHDNALEKRTKHQHHHHHHYQQQQQQLQLQQYQKRQYSQIQDADTQQSQHQRVDEGPYALREDIDESRNPGLDQNKWVAIKSVPRSDILEDVNEETKLAEGRRPAVVDLVDDIQPPRTVTEPAVADIGPAKEAPIKKS
ncbi:PREDICTED: uncharacterized protein LOC105366615 [Ceratosolen solmsi marchali]|uniref:Uncharacterized protein LOC105366615 n=1 Tax=Ceratosolen solmsi marchali TaxID=326594 RepID=A0AAJ7E0Q0_9HYME|nr:PREDICTED: uncharacterized protein LOC105366615 [Ceratosolen solmsi marchali]